jgi:hypothetical protein
MNKIKSLKHVLILPSHLVPAFQVELPLVMLMLKLCALDGLTVTVQPILEYDSCMFSTEKESCL